jgi:ABC-type transport system involved in multi-copper enzyme maturation permease subunit
MTMTPGNEVSNNVAWANPIVRRELVGILRTRRAASVLVLCAAFFAGLIALRWPSDARVDLSGFQSRDVFELFGYGLLSTVLLLAPIVPALSIVREKQSGTLALLMNSPMTRWSIYWGKLSSCLGLVLLLLAISLPAAAACFAMGGISLDRDLLRLYTVLVIAALQIAALSLWVSTLARSSESALRITYGCVLLLAIICLGPHLFFQGAGTRLADWADWLRCVSPIAAVMAIVGHGDVGSQGILSGTDVVARYLLLASVTITVCGGMTLSRLDFSLFDRARSQGLVTDERSTAVRSFRRVFYLVDPLRRSRTIGPWVNPVMVKEFRCRMFGRTHWMLRLAAASALVSLLLTYATTQGTLAWGVKTIGGIMVLLQAALVVLLVPSLTAGLISSEMESGGWRLLQMTPLTAGRILRGKLASVIWPVLLIIVSTLPGYLVMVYIQPDLWLRIQHVLICLGVTSLFAISLSLAASAVFPRTALAMAVSYGTLILICGGSMVIWLLRDAPFGYQAVRLALLVNPIAGGLQVIGAPGFVGYRLLPTNWWIAGMASFAFAVIVLIQTHRRLRSEP